MNDQFDRQIDQQIDQLKAILNSSSNIVFFGGAGMSTESGIPDFRSAHGIYSERLHQHFTPEEMVSHGFFVNHTAEFYQFYRDKMIYLDAKPNAGHIALAELERRGKLKAIITQNIDGLHQAAGSKIVYELHGSVHRNYCVKCHAPYSVEYILNEKPVPHCTKCGGIVKPDVVLYGEGLDDDVISKSIAAIRAADTLIIGGTSLIVYPAAGLVNYFHGANLILINKTETSADASASLVIHAAIGAVLSRAIG